MQRNRGTADGALTDRAWQGYDPRAAVPLAAVAALASAALLAGRWYLDDLTAALVPYALVLALWPGLLGLALYRTITWTYRLTDRALLVDRGFLSRPEPPVWLRDVAKVECGANWLARQLAIGWLRVTTTEHRVVILTALRDPTAFAARLGDLIAEVKAKPSPLRIAAGSL